MVWMLFYLELVLDTQARVEHTIHSGTQVNYTMLHTRIVSRDLLSSHSLIFTYKNYMLTNCNKNI
jgi:hypothetical protein